MKLRFASRVGALFVAATVWVGPLTGASVVINEVFFDPTEKRATEFIELFNASTNAVSLAGWKIEKFKFATHSVIAPGGFVVVAKDPLTFTSVFGGKPLGPLPGKLQGSGEKITLHNGEGKLVDMVDFDVGFPWPTAAAGAGSSLERINAGLDGRRPGSWRSSGFPSEGKPQDKRPTPGKQNSVWATNAPPTVAMVSHFPMQPKSGTRMSVSARVEDPDGVRSVVLQLQVVEPGAYLRKSDADYEKRWQEMVMHDDGTEGDAVAGDGHYFLAVPPEIQKHRRLIRYRIIATDGVGLKVRVPYSDDDCPNFAWFCYDGIPAWSGSSQPGKTPALDFSPEFLGTLPVYHLIASADDVERSQWDGGYNKRRLFGTFVYNGRVYDHVQFQNRGQASTHVSGKNKWGIHFNRAHEFHARDHWDRAYAKPWDHLNLSGCASPWVQVNRGMAGMDEAVSFRAYQLAGVPSANTHWIHFRVLSRAEEASAKSQYEGDLWGLYLSVQDPDGGWLKDLDLPEGNTYSPETGRKHLAAGMPANNADFNDFMNGSRSTNLEKWWRDNLDLPAYYSFHAMNRVVSNVDLRHGANHFLYHPHGGKWSPVPWDLDMMFIPKTHWPGIIDQARCLDQPNLRREYQNRAREILDLFCSDTAPNGGQIGQLVDELAGALRPAGHPRDWGELDMAMWNFHPRTNDKGAFYRNPAQQGMSGGTFERRLTTPDFDGFCKYIVEFCADSRAQKNYKPNDGDPRGYGFGHLAWEAKDDLVPNRPVIRYVGPAGYPINELTFSSSPLVVPAGGGKLAAVQWRVGNIRAPGLQGYVVGQPRRYEIEPHWTSDEMLPQYSMRLPPTALSPGEVFRVRARYKDTDGRWSHWSAPIQIEPSRR